MVKRILCFGDSNTYGYIPGGNGRRYGPDVRWTGLLSAWLKPECLIIEEGLPGRTTVFEDPILPGRKGSDYFYPCLWSHAPLDMLLLMLGTNDCKMRFGASAKNIASGMEALVRMAISTPVWAATPKVLLISPPPMTPEKNRAVSAVKNPVNWLHCMRRRRNASAVRSLTRASRFK